MAATPQKGGDDSQLTATSKPQSSPLQEPGDSTTSVTSPDTTTRSRSVQQKETPTSPLKPDSDYFSSEEQLDTLEKFSHKDDACAEVRFDNLRKLSRKTHLNKCCVATLNDWFRPLYVEGLKRPNSRNSVLKIASCVRPACMGTSTIIILFGNINGEDGFRDALHQTRDCQRQMLLNLLEACNTSQVERYANIWKVADALGLNLDSWQRGGKPVRGRVPGSAKAELVRLNDEERRENSRKTREQDLLEAQEDFYRQQEIRDRVDHGISVQGRKYAVFFTRQL